MAPIKNLSILIPHYQKQDILVKTWEELQLQLHPQDEILIIDDYSPDGVPEFDCNCTKVVHPPEKLTPHIYRLNTLRNYGLEQAHHDACLILDPDCLPSPHFLDNARKICDPTVLFGGRIDKTTKEGEIKQDIRVRDNVTDRWVDVGDRQTPGVEIYGGCMLFSRSRTKLFGWFDTDFDGVWGAEEHEFASRAYHSGMRLRYTSLLHVTHQWHPHVTREGYERNRKLWT